MKMALELATANIRVNIVALGAVKTDMTRELGENKVYQAKVLKRIPMGLAFSV